MSKLARAVALAAMLAAMNLAGMTATAHAYPVDPAADHRVTTQQQSTADATVQRSLAQERYYSTWGYGDTSAPAPDEPNGQPGWLTPALSALSVVLALIAGVAVLAARRANRAQRAGQTA